MIRFLMDILGTVTDVTDDIIKGAILIVIILLCFTLFAIYQMFKNFWK